MKNIRRIIQMAVILISWGGLAVVSNSSELSVSTKVVPTTNIHAQYASGYDGSVERTMDFAEYVFVGKVIEYCDTQYEDKVTFKNRYGKEQVGANTYTRYKVEILENIKNELPIGAQIIVKKLGGIREDLSCVDVLENDELPETKKLMYSWRIKSRMNI